MERSNQEKYLKYGVFFIKNVQTVEEHLILIKTNLSIRYININHKNKNITVTYQ